MTKKEAIKVFEEKKVRAVWDSDQEDWYFSVVDVIAVLTDSTNPTDYLKKMRKRDSELGLFLGTNCPQITMMTETGKRRKTLAADTKALFRIIQSIPSPKAEPFKLWMAQVARERLDEMQDPELTIDRAMMEYKRLGYSDNWINQRLKSIEVRKDLTDEPMTNREQNCACTSFAEVRKRKAKPMEKERIERRCTICDSYGYYNPGMGRNDYKGIQEFQRTEKRKSQG